MVETVEEKEEGSGMKMTESVVLAQHVKTCETLGVRQSDSQC